ncbi:hypothetical protein COV04_01730 [Candidatus Uhrbacteria bacterium CG10_big_fil_rev_8_21_14_0_10_48_11]|uniref:Uncharacterized protein n=1 Tax=Candidatus Uhrbacteria bacterium CG10_big_fil_rev_8_21_14_0_10_48_11 TaxID=1975037 RepID=A0A2M8LF36_9BACT|nr:MAG: hypothetical protein COV04_01730 [Candidatus Uhrbacteria bacterium CG10_big_fil_rev_8_21_14_0_10_48_11]
MISTALYAKAFVDVYEAADSVSAASAAVDRFVGVIAAERLTPLVPALLDAVSREVELRERKSATTIDVAHPATEKTFALFTHPVLREDKSIIGGFRARAQSRSIDASLEGALEQLRAAMKSV